MRSAGHRRLLASSALGVLAFTMGPAVLAGSLPSGGVVAAGQAQIGQSSPSTLTINQQSSRAIINWDGFSVGQGQSVQFNNGAGATLNRVTGSQGSAIDGLLSATGNIYLINPNGVIIGKTGIVNVGGTFVAATQNVLDSQFMGGGDLTFSGSSTAAVINYGKIGSLGGDVALIASKVDNEGEIDAPNGDVGLISGYTVIMRDMALDNGKFAVQVGGPDTSATNAGQINAATAELRANGGNVYALAGNTASVIKADGVAVNDGKVFLVADGGTVNVSGTTVEASASDGSGGQIAVTGQTVNVDAATVLDASATSTAAVKNGGAIKVNADAALSFKGKALARGGAAGGDGGSVETSGATIDFDGASVDTTAGNGLDGNWLIDPYDLTVTASAASTISTSLATGNVTLQTTATGTSGAGTANANGVGDININAAISWSANHTLTLNAYRNININAAITAGGSPGVTLLYGQGAVAAGNTATYNVAAPVNLKAGTTFSTKLGSNGTAVSYTVITTLGAQGSATKADLQGISGSLTTNYVLGANIDASTTATWNRSGGIYQGFSPLGTSSSAFKGIFDGLGHTISNLNINRSSTSYAGLFGNSSGTIQNVSLIGGSVTGSSDVGALVGKNSGVLNNVSSSTAVTSTANNSQYVGGLVGYSSTAIVNGYATGAVSSNGNDVGGLVGYSTVAIAGDYATGTVSGNSYVGGLAGYSNGGISNSNATGNVTGSNQYAGGLTGYNTGGAISNSFAKGIVSGYDYVGGLVGKSLGSISGSYASGNVTSTDSWVGGLAGYSGGGIDSSNASGNVIGNNVYAGGLTGFNTGGNISNSFATGSVSGAYQYVGGLIGYNDIGATISNSNAAGAVSGDSYVGGLAGYSLGDITNNSYATGNLTVTGSYVGGLAGYSGGNISNSYATGNIVGANYYAGGLAGYSTGGGVSNTYATGTVSGYNSIGGLIGISYDSITNSYAIGAVSGTSGIGGLIGYGTGITVGSSYATGAVTGTYGYIGGLAGEFDTGALNNIYATGAVTNTDAVAGGAYTGGLVGYLGNTSAVTTVTNAYATGNVTAGPAVGGQTGGLIGAITNGASVTNAYATGNVIGTALTGGLVGENDDTILNAYATGSVTGTINVGGLVGSNYSHITNTYSTGFVSGTSNVGGLIGSDQYSHVTSSYWNTQTSGQSTSANGTPLTTAQFQTLSTFTNGGWSIDDQGGTSAIWRIYDGETAPLLRSFMTTLDLSGSSNSRVYNGATQTLSLPTGTDPTLLTVASGLHAGTYQSASVQQGYDIIGGVLTITSQPITITAAPSSKFYDGSTTASATPTVTSGTLYDTATLSESYAGKDVGSTIVLTPTATIANAGDYAVTYVSSNLGVITPAVLTASLTGTVSKVYNDSTAASLTSGNYSLTGVVAGDSVSLNGPTSGTYDTVHAGTGKTVSVIGLTLANNAAGDYVLARRSSSLSAAIGTITPEAITVTATANSKVYDGTTAASATPTVTSGTLYDTATLSESYAGKDVGNAIALTPTATIANAGDYTVSYASSNLGVITPATLTASLTATVSKVYNDSTAAILASGNYSLTGVVAGDSVSLNGPASGTYDTVHAGTGKTVSVTGLTLTNNTAGDYVLAASSLSAAIGAITPEAITVTASANSKVYDGSTIATATPTVTSGTLYDTATLSESYGGKDVGNTIALTPTATIANVGDYAVTYVSSNLGVITPATLTASLTGTVSKVYNDSTAATLASGNYSLTGVVAGDSVSLTGPSSGTYDTVHAGTGKTVSVTGLTLANNTAGDYVLAASSLSAAIGTITPETITVTATANSKVYNGTTTASATPTVTSGTLYDAAILSESYAGKDVGNTIALTPTATIANAGDYNVTYVSSNLGVITPATLTASLTGTVSKVYDSSTAASLASGNYSLTGIVAGDSVSLNGPAVGTYDTVHAGTGKTVSVTGLTLANNTAGDYVLAASSLSAAIGTITPEAITVTATANSKVYDGTTAASATPTVTSGTLYDTATLSETYAGKDVGSTIALTPTATIANAGDYAVTYVSSNLGVITPATLTASLTGTVSKVYDSSTAATLASGNYSLTGIVAGDSVSLNGPASGTYDTVHAGTGKTVSVTGLTLANNAAGDYVLAASSLSAAIGTITPEAITITASANSKVYNGSTAASATPTVTNGTLYDAATLSETYAGKDVGSAIKLTPTAAIVNAGDYNVTYVASNLGVITPTTLTATVTGTVEKTYDGNYVAPVTAAQLSLSGVVSGDSVSLTAPTAAQYDTPNVGTGKTVGATGYSLTGASAGDYTVNAYAFGNVGIIDPKALTASITGTIEKTYSGNNFAIVPSSQLALAGVVSGDSVGVTASYSNYDNASAGTGKTVYATGLTLTGSSAANYTVSYYTTGNVGIIDPKAITASLTGTVSKTYDGTTTATLSAANYTISGIVTGDQVSITTTAGTYATKNAGSNIAVTVNGLQLGGAQASDYKLTLPSLTAAIGVITPQIITFGPSNPLGLIQWTQLNASAPGDYVLN
jgi:filamentous hemagglutinin family protein